MKKYGHLVVLVLFGLLVVLPSYAISEKSGKQTRMTASFHGISVSSGIDLYMSQGDSEAVTVEADVSIIDDVITEVEDGILRIYMKKKLSWIRNEARTVFVTFDDLTRLDVSAGADVEAENAFHLDELEITVSAGADLEIGDLNAKTVWLDTSTGSDAELSGRVINFEASSSSGADISCAHLVAENCQVSVSSGSDATVHATKVLKANASSGGDIRYKGNPAHKDINESSGGDVYAF
ncbi:head GIN domain-containing protein [Sunxiuqinia sp. sy24]|uniref:head GIN domain-containing protein n=1 Tax=Sunxiuqinia sp. sy24 TaxID=3461495 RepID=UPI0040455410